MGKDLKGKELGIGFSQRKGGRYEARAVINGVKIDIYDFNFTNLKKQFDIEKAKAITGKKSVGTDGEQILSMGISCLLQLLDLL